MPVLCRYCGCRLAGVKVSLLEPKLRTDEVVWNRLKPDPSSAQAFGGFAGGATAGKRVQDQVACFGQKLYEELGKLNREAGWVGRRAKSKV
jgi:hypothetical protein